MGHNILRIVTVPVSVFLTNETLDELQDNEITCLCTSKDNKFSM